MIYANCEVYENGRGETAVLTRTDDNRVDTFLINYKNPDDASINFDKRLIEFYLANPNASYREWDKLLADCGYEVSLFENDFPESKDPTDLYYDELMERYGEPVHGFEITYVPKDMFVRISNEPVYDEYADYAGEHQIVLAYSEEDFIKT